MNSNRIKLFKLLGFQVWVDPSWIILAILVAWSLSAGFFPFHYEDLSTGAYWTMGIIGAIGLFLSIIVHEFSHSVVARSRGIPMKGITLFLFGGVAEMSEEPPDAKSEFMMAVIGPISSILIGVVFYGAYRVGLQLNWPVEVNGVVQYLAYINVVLAVFNMVPAFPLDGGRVLRSVLWGARGNLRWATRISSRIGAGFGIFMIIFGVINFISGNIIGGAWLFLIGLFLKRAADGSYQQLMIRNALAGESLKRFVKSDPVTVPPSISIEEMVENYVYKFHHKLYPVVEKGNLLGCITTREVKTIPRESWKTTRVIETANKCSPQNTISPKADAVEALSQMRRNNISRLMVVEGEKLVGVATLKDMLDFLSLKIELD